MKCILSREAVASFLTASGGIPLPRDHSCLFLAGQVFYGPEGGEGKALK